LRILIIPTSDWLSHPIPSRLHFIFERLADRHEIHVIRYPIPLWNVRRNSKAFVHEAASFPIRDLSLYYVINAPNHLLLLDNILKSNKIDAIVFANILTGVESIIFGKKHRIPLVCDYLDHFPESASSYYTNPFAKTLVEAAVANITKWNLNKANYVVTVSKCFLNWLKEVGIRNTTLIPNGVDLQEFTSADRDDARERIGIRELEGKFVVTYTGSVESWYDLDMVARATQILNRLGVPTVFQVVGGHLVNRDNNRSIGFQRNVVQTGFVDNKSVSSHINASDVCVLPLKKMAKNLTRPLKLLEYFSCGKPVFMLPNSELELEFGDAITVYHNADELAKILLESARNPDKFLHKIEKGYRYAQMNSWDNHATSYEKLLKRIVDSNA